MFCKSEVLRRLFLGRKPPAVYCSSSSAALRENQKIEQHELAVMTPALTSSKTIATIDNISANSPDGVSP